MKWKGIVMGVVVVAVVAVVAIVVGINLCSSEKPFLYEMPESVSPVNDVSALGSGAENKVVVPGQGNFSVSRDGAVAGANICNPPENTGKYVMIFDIRMKEEPETLYYSDLVSAGECRKNIKLLRVLEPGEYMVTIIVQPYRVDNGKKTNNANFDALLEVE